MGRKTNSSSGFCRMAMFLLVVLAVAGVQQRCEAQTQFPEAIVVVRNHPANQAVTFLVTIGGVVAAVAPGEELTFKIIFEGYIAVVRQDGMKAKVPCTFPGPGIQPNPVRVYIDAFEKNIVTTYPGQKPVSADFQRP